MALNNPGVETRLLPSSQPINPQSYHARGIAIGYSSRGTRNQLYVLRDPSDLAQYGNGEGIEQVAEIGNQAGYPVAFMPVEGTGQTPETPDKTPASGAIAKIVYGQIKLAGADANGDLLFQALVLGATLTVQTGMSLDANTSGTGVVLTVPAMTTANAVEAWWNGVSPAAVAARAVFSIATEGTGASNAGTTLALTAANAGNLTFEAPDEGYEVRVVASGNLTALSASYGGTGNRQLTINLQTDADGTPISTAAAVKAAADAALPVPAAGRITITSGGTGLAGTQASFYALGFGSTAALSVSGTTFDEHDIRIRFTKGGAVGATGIAYIWSADAWVTQSAPQQLPTSGIINTLKDAVLDTNLVLTFTGTIEVGDEWAFHCDKPDVAFADVQTAVDALLSLTGLRYGFVVTTIPHSRTQLALMDATFYAARDRVHLRYRAPMRDIADGESRADYENALAADLLGFNSQKGIVAASAGSFSHLSTYTRRRYQRLVMFHYVAARAALALHQDPMEKALGALKNIRYAKSAAGVVTDPGISYDAYPNGSLPSARLICMRTWDSEGDGLFFYNNSPTLHDPSEPQYCRVPYIDVLYESTRTAQRKLEDVTIGKSFRSIDAPEGDLIPSGAIDKDDASRIDVAVNQDVGTLLYSIKTDGNTSAGDLAPGQAVYATLRNYSYAATDPKTVKGAMQIKIRGIAEYATLDVEPRF